ncbi:MAG: LPP20 family lipoprotein [Bacteroidetes bacterium]|nr:LPP20 family lipoprotein [Bacteroidota bacterium]MBU1678529.1 LPP20 family lipoprotein [Bacteroidota bacterium]MBU2508242.1 LPP20 family lipoprotein [Bacteroidota bacterium]
MKSIFISIFVLLILSFLGCSSTKTLQGVDLGDVPDWYKKLPESKTHIYSARTATSRDMQVAIDKASVDARAEIAQKVEVQIKQLQKRFTEEMGSGEDPTLVEQFSSATKAVVNVSLSGSSIEEKDLFDDDDFWRAYVLMKYPIGDAQKEFLSQIRNNNYLAARVTATEAFKELDNELKNSESK